MPLMSGLTPCVSSRLKDRTHASFPTIPHRCAPGGLALRAGASGYPLKQAAGEELLEAVRTVMDGRTYLTPLITKDVL